jgi:amino acid permease
MAYKTMPQATYMTVSLLLYVLELLAACWINDITTVFDFASAIAVSFISFWFPSIYFLIAEKKYGRGQDYYHYMAWFLNILGVLNFALGISTGLINIINK